MASFTDRVRAAWLALPAPVQLAAADVVVTLGGVVISLNLGIPNTLGEVKAQLLLVSAAIAGAGVRVVATAIRKYIIPAALSLIARTFRPA